MITYLLIKLLSDLIWIFQRKLKKTVHLVHAGCWLYDAWASCTSMLNLIFSRFFFISPTSSRGLSGNGKKDTDEKRRQYTTGNGRTLRCARLYYFSRLRDGTAISNYRSNLRRSTVLFGRASGRAGPVRYDCCVFPVGPRPSGLMDWRDAGDDRMTAEGPPTRRPPSQSAATESAQPSTRPF